jgi:hypothetical protein
MTFYGNTRIEYWQARDRSLLRLAFEESRRRHTVTRGDRELVRGRFRHELLAVNSFSRRIWGEVTSDQLSMFFCDGGDGSGHKQDVLFVSLMDVTCARSPEDQLTEADLEFIKNRLRYGLRGFSYIGMIEPAYYVNLQQGVRYDGKRCMFWHLHTLVWGISRKKLKKHLGKLAAAGWYSAIADGLDPTHTRKIKQGRLPAHVAYLLKSPSKAYRVSVRDREDAKSFREQRLRGTFEHRSIAPKNDQALRTGCPVDGKCVEPVCAACFPFYSPDPSGLNIAATLAAGDFTSSDSWQRPSPAKPARTITFPISREYYRLKRKLISRLSTETNRRNYDEPPATDVPRAYGRNPACKGDGNKIDEARWAFRNLRRFVRSVSSVCGVEATKDRETVGCVVGARAVHYPA